MTEKRRSGRHSDKSPAPEEAEPPASSGPRRTGRHTVSTTADTPVAKKDSAKKPPQTAPVKGRTSGPASSSTPAASAAPPKRDPKSVPTKSRFAPAEGGGHSAGTSGSRSLRQRAAVSLKEVSDDEDGLLGSEEEQSDRSDAESEEGAPPEDYESEIDETVYKPPPEGSLPVELVICEGGGEGGAPRLVIPSAAVGDLMAAYALIRSFSWQLRLAPFPFEDLCAAMATPLPSQLMDEVHTCVLRALAVDETPTERADRKLDLALLDGMSWPCYVWEWLHLTEDPLAAHEWAQRAKCARAPATAAAADAEAGAEPEGEAAAEGSYSAATQACGSSPLEKELPRVAFAPLDEAAMDAELAKSPDAAPEATAESIFADRQPAAPQPQPEYYSLPIEVKAAILSRLCDHVLDCTTLRAEIDRREANGLFVAGRGGQGGAFAIMSPDEKRRAETRAARQQQSDANTDTCVLCGLGGNLLCCDGCPAAYHMRCLGETAKTLGEGEWMCPECVVGGRGETAGLRIPPAARNKWKQPFHLLNGAVLRSELPAVKSRGKRAVELPGAVPAVRLVGEPAAEALAAASRVRSADEVPLPSSFDMVKNPPAWPVDAATAGPEGYCNKYRNGWNAGIAAIKSTVEDAKRRKHKGGIWVPTGTCGHLIVPELPAPTPVSRFQWVQLQGRPLGRLTTRCGKCHTCQRPTLRKGCLNPIARTGDEAAATAESSKLSFLIAFVAKVEREFWALAEGPWEAERGGGMQFRNLWAAAVRSASSAADLASCVLQLEAALRTVAFKAEWFGEGGAAAAGKAGAGSRAVSRCASMAELPDSGGDAPAGAANGAKGEKASEGEEEEWGASGSGAGRQQRQDPYDIRFEPLVLSGWEMDRRHHAARIARVNRLPRELVNKAARRAGHRPIPGVKYRKQKWAVTSPRLEWVAEAEAVQTTAHLAMALRKLDAVMHWDAVIKPRHENESRLFHAAIQGKRAAADGSGYEYLVQQRQVAGPQEALAMQVRQQQQARQQQLAAAFVQQRMMMMQAQGQQGPPQAQGQGFVMPGQQPAPGRLGSLSQWPPQGLMAPPMPAPGAQVHATSAQPLLWPRPPLQREAQPQLAGSTYMQYQQQQQQQGMPDLGMPWLQAPGGYMQPPRPPPQEQQQAKLAVPAAMVPPSTAEAADGAQERNGDKEAAAAPGGKGAAASASASEESALSAGSDGDGSDDASSGGGGLDAGDGSVGMEVENAAAPEEAVAAVGSEPAGGRAAEEASMLEEEQLAAAAAGQEVLEAQCGAVLAPTSKATGAEGNLGLYPPALSTQPSASGGGPGSTYDVSPAPGATSPNKSPSGRPIRRCGQCFNCLNPAHKKACSRLAAQREERSVSALASELERRLEAARLAEDPSHIAHVLVNGAIKKALDAAEREEYLKGDAPAAVTAKMRSRLSVGSGLGASGGAATADASEKAGPSKQPVPPPAALFPAGFGGALALPPLPPAAAFASGRMMPPSFLSGAPTQPPRWMHERVLPLWLVRQYEETSRRDAANAAARELQAAARSRSLLQQDSTAMDAARKAAHAAAAAAADACGVCAAAQGDEEDLDALWICCDTCSRWFHGACVAMTQDDVDAIAEDDAWNCPGCWNARRKAERAARRREGKAEPQSPAEGAEAPKRGRPPKPFYEKADYKAGERSALERLQRQKEREGKRAEGGEPGGGGGGGWKKGKKRPREGETQEQAEARQAERAKRKRECEEAAAKEEALPVHCPVCQFPDHGRPLVACDACQRWFHYECVGTAVEEVEQAVANRQVLRCAECQGKRCRPPSQAAIQAAILAAAERAEAGGSGARPLKRVKLAVGAPAAPAGPGIGGRHTEASWREAAARALSKTMRLPAATIFCRPVAPEEAPDYIEAVAHPVDLGTLRASLEQRASPVEVVAGVQQIVDNCMLYNGEESDFSAAALEMQRGFQRLWQQEALPLTAELWRPARTIPPPRPAPAAAAVGAGASGSTKRRSDGGQAPAAAQPAKKPHRASGGGAAAPPPFAVPAPDWPARAARVLSSVARLKTALHFLEPVPRGFMNYHQVISSPMDLGTIGKKLARGQYAHPALLAADVALVWANCRQFNEPSAEAVVDAAATEASFNRHWANSGVYASGGEGGGDAWRRSRADAWRESAKNVLYRLSNFCTAAAWFEAPVPLDEVPDYTEVVKRPMDLGTVSERLLQGEYAAPAELAADVALIWSNAAAYNGPDHEVTRAAQAAGEVFNKYWRKAGLAGDAHAEHAAARSPLAAPPRPSAAPAAARSPAAAAPRSGSRASGRLPATAAGPPTAPAPSGGGGAAGWMVSARGVLDAALAMPEAQVFAEPVSADQAPGYFDVVKRPMDLGTARRRLVRRQYATPLALLGDVALVFDNCRAYNDPEDDVFEWGERVEGTFYREWRAAGLPLPR